MYDSTVVLLGQWKLSRCISEVHSNPRRVALVSSWASPPIHFTFQYFICDLSNSLLIIHIYDHPAFNLYADWRNPLSSIPATFDRLIARRSLQSICTSIETRTLSTLSVAQWHWKQSRSVFYLDSVLHRVEVTFASLPTLFNFKPPTP